MTQSEALDILKLGHNVYLTGPAGSGKTHILNTYISFLKEYGVEIGITASTGIAATHMNGVTIHSWSGIGIKNSLSEMELGALEEKEYLFNRIQKTKVLIIDEVSMLHHYRLDLVERICRLLRRSEEPFGGMQVILSGDFFQLPPVSRGGDPEAHFINHSDIWKAMDLKVCYLEEQYRQRSGDFALDVLNDIRANDVTEDTLNHLRRRYKKEPHFDNGKKGVPVIPTKLYTHNIDVDTINNQELEKLDAQSKVYEMTSKGKKGLIESLKKSCLAPEHLALKVGAQVMFVKNNFDVGYVNGTLGVVVDFDATNAPIIETISNTGTTNNEKGGKRIVAEEASWSIEEDGEVKAEITQLPLRLAWAITVHKSQGMSLDAIEVDLSKSFVPGMGYVALSRVRTLDGLKLLGLNDIAMQVHPEILELDHELKERSKEVAVELAVLDKKEKNRLQKKYIERIAPSKTERKKRQKEKEEESLTTYDKTRLLVLEKTSLSDMAHERKMTEETILTHLEKLKEKHQKINLDYLKPEAKRLKKIKKAFEKSKDKKLTPIKRELGSTYSFIEIRIGRLFL